MIRQGYLAPLYPLINHKKSPPSDWLSLFGGLSLCTELFECFCGRSCGSVIDSGQRFCPSAGRRAENVAALVLYHQPLTDCNRLEFPCSRGAGG